MTEPIHVTDASFEADILKSDKPVLVDFWAEWCGPCHMVAPHVAAIAEEHGETLTVAKMDVDDNPAVPGRYGVTGIPTLMLFQNGEVVKRMTGAYPKDRILAEISEYIKN